MDDSEYMTPEQEPEYIDAGPFLVGMALDGLSRGLEMPFDTHWPGHPESRWRINALKQEITADGVIRYVVNAQYLNEIPVLILETTIGPAPDPAPED